MSASSVALIITLVTVSVFSLLGILNLQQRSIDVEEYITSRNRIGSHMAIATIVASIVGAWLLLSPAEAATWAGIPGIIGYGVGQAAPLIAYAYLGPRLRQLMPHGHSLTEYVWYRFGAAMYGFTVVIMLFYMFVFLAAELTGIAQALSLVADVPLGWTALIITAATLIYTTYGGLQATIFTDSIQFALIVPLLLATFVVAVVSLGGWSNAFGPVTENAPQLLSPTFAPGVEFGVTLVIAILAANLFHQGFWQRVYACRSPQVLYRAYWIAGLITIPLILITGLMGLMAVGYGVPAEQSSVALFVLVSQVFPQWALMLVLVLAIALVMSSMDTLLNGMTSTVTSDLARWRSAIPSRHLLRIARVMTVLISIPAVLIAAQGYSVLYLFLIADLVCAGALFPVFCGLYSRRLTGTHALTSALVGIVVGVLFFPKPDFTPWLEIPLAGRFLMSFGSALVVSTLLSLVLSRLGRSASRFDFATLEQQVHEIKG